MFIEIYEMNQSMRHTVSVWKISTWKCQRATLYSDNFHDQNLQPNHETPHWHVTLTYKLWKKSRPEVRNNTIGTLSKDDDDGSENIGNKMNLCSFKLNRVYLDRLNMSNAGDFSWGWILKNFIHVQKEEGKFVFVCPRPP